MFPRCCPPLVWLQIKGLRDFLFRMRAHLEKALTTGRGSKTDKSCGRCSADSAGRGSFRDQLKAMDRSSGSSGSSGSNSSRRHKWGSKHPHTWNFGPSASDTLLCGWLTTSNPCFVDTLFLRVPFEKACYCPAVLFCSPMGSQQCIRVQPFDQTRSSRPHAWVL